MLADFSVLLRPGTSTERRVHGQKESRDNKSAAPVRNAASDETMQAFELSWGLDQLIIDEPKKWLECPSLSANPLAEKEK
jgi:hypothetical protein